MRGLWGLFPVPDSMKEDPVARLILGSNVVVIFLLLMLGVMSGTALVLALDNRRDDAVTSEASARLGCITDLRSIESRAQGEELDAILRGLAISTGLNPETLQRYAEGEQVERQADIEEQVRLGLAALDARQQAQGELDQPRLNEICGRPPG